jgi:hypothetical protein
VALAAFLLIASLLLGAGSVLSYRKLRSAASWPTCQAQVVADPRTNADRIAGAFFLRHRYDSDYVLEWVVEGASYRQRLKSKANIDIGPFPVSIAPPNLEPQLIRYNPANPAECFLGDDAVSWKVLFGFSVAAFLGAGIAWFV